jgi:predicted transcriptional regulator
MATKTKTEAPAADQPPVDRALPGFRLCVLGKIGGARKRRMYTLHAVDYEAAWEAAPPIFEEMAKEFDKDSDIFTQIGQPLDEQRAQVEAGLRDPKTGRLVPKAVVKAARKAAKAAKAPKVSEAPAEVPPAPQAPAQQAPADQPPAE